MRILPFTRLPAASQVGFGAAPRKRSYRTWSSLTRTLLIRPASGLAMSYKCSLILVTWLSVTDSSDDGKNEAARRPGGRA